MMMFKRFFFIMFMTMSLVSLSSVAKAQSDEAASDYSVNKVGLIDLPYVLRNAAATNTIRELLDAKKTEFSVEFQGKEADLLRREKELNLRRTLLSEADFNAEVQAFQEDVAAVQREIQFKRNSLDQAFQEAQDNLRQIALEIITAIAQREQLDVVMTKETALIFRPALNITDEVLATLNERTKNARIEVGTLPF